MRTISLRSMLYRRVSRTRQPLSTEGSRLSGGRYNEPGTPALYAACARTVANMEFEKHRAKTGLAVDRPGLAVVIQAELELLDLMDAENRSRLSVTLEDLCSDSVEATRRIGEAARLAGYQGIRYPAAVDPTSCNVVVFTENTGPDALTVVSLDDDWPAEQ
jgi:RES domain-containing protein